jgi:hypothetical protein
VAAWTLAFAVVFYLAMSNGGYDTIVRSQVGIAVWWIVPLGALTGVLPMRSAPPAGSRSDCLPDSRRVDRPGRDLVGERRAQRD